MKKLIWTIVLCVVFCTFAAAAADTYTVAVDPSYPPFTSVDADGNFTGIDIYLIEAIAADQGFEVKYVSVDFDLLIDSVAKGTYDIGLGAITRTEEREKKVAMSDPYYVSGQVTLINKNSEIFDALVDLTGLCIGVKEGTVAEELAKPYEDAWIETYFSTDELLDALRREEVDAVLVDKDVADSLAEDDCLIRVGEPMSSEDLVIISNPQDARLAKMIDHGLAAIKKNGMLAAVLMEMFE